jgi:hypothetical protein
LPEILRSIPEIASASTSGRVKVCPPIEFGEGRDVGAAFRELARALGVDARVEVFISYSRVDRTIADDLDRGLRAAGKRTWIDRSDLKPTDDWWRAIKAGIEAADNFLFVISPASVASPHCKEEVEYAAGLAKADDPGTVVADERRLDPEGSAGAAVDHVRPGGGE